jgi:hypothetical protein
MSNSLGEALKSALAKQWASDDEAHNKMEGKGKKLFAPTNNVTRATFDEVRDSPATRSVIIKRLTSLGYKENSVSSLITQMLKQGMLRLDKQGVLQATTPTYVPLKPWKHRVAVQTKPKIVIKKKEAKLVVEKKEEKPVREERRPVSNTIFLGWSTREILENLDIFQARAVYDELKQIFGNAK